MKKAFSILALTAMTAAFATFAADKPKFTAGSCCDKAQKAGKECAHPCCVTATKDGKVCAKCNK